MSKTNQNSPAVIALGEIVGSLYGIAGLVESLPHLVTDQATAVSVGQEILRRLNGLRNAAATHMLKLSGDGVDKEITVA